MQPKKKERGGPRVNDIVMKKMCIRDREEGGRVMPVFRCRGILNSFLARFWWPAGGASRRASPPC